MNILERNEKFGEPTRRFDVGITDRLAALARVPAHLVDAAISVAVGMAGETSANALAEMIEGKKSATGSHQIVDSLRAAYQGLKVILGREPKASEYVDNVTGPLTAAMQWLRVGYEEPATRVRFNARARMPTAQGLRDIEAKGATLAFSDAPWNELAATLTGDARVWVERAKSESAGGSLSGARQALREAERRAGKDAEKVKGFRERFSYDFLPKSASGDSAEVSRRLEQALQRAWDAAGDLSTFNRNDVVQAIRQAMSARDLGRAHTLIGTAIADLEASKNTTMHPSWFPKVDATIAALRAAQNAMVADLFWDAADLARFFDPTNWPPTRDEALQVLRDAAANPDLAPGQRTVVAGALATLEGGAALTPAAEKKLLALGLKARHRGASLTDLAALTDYLAAGMFAFGETQKFGELTDRLASLARVPAHLVDAAIMGVAGAYDWTRAQSSSGFTSWLAQNSANSEIASAADAVGKAYTSLRLALGRDPSEQEIRAEIARRPSGPLTGLLSLVGAFGELGEPLRYSADLPLWRFAMVAGGEEYMTRDEWKQRRAAAGNPVANNPLGEFLSDAAELGVRWMGSGIAGVAKVGAALARLTGSTIAGLAAAPFEHAARVVKEALRGSRRDIDAAKALIDDDQVARAIGVLVMPTSDWNEPSVLERSERFGEPERFAGFPISIITTLPFFALWRLQEYAAEQLWNGLSAGAQALVSSLSSALSGGADPEAVAQAAEADPELGRKLPARGPNGRFIRVMGEGGAVERFSEEALVKQAIDSAQIGTAGDDLWNLVKRQAGWLWRQATGTAAATAALATIVPATVPMYAVAAVGASLATLWANHNYTARLENEALGNPSPRILGIFGEPWEPMEFDESAWSGEVVSFEEKRRRAERFATKHDSKTGRFAPGKGGGGGAKKSAKTKGRQAEPEGDLDHTSGGPKGSPEKHKVQSKRLIDYIKRRGPKRHAEGDVLTRNARFAG